jgi:hypothetical protein
MVFMLVQVLNSGAMGYQGNKGNLPKTEEQPSDNTNRQSSNTEELHGKNTEQTMQTSDTSSAENTGSRDTETDTIGNP